MFLIYFFQAVIIIYLAYLAGSIAQRILKIGKIGSLLRTKIRTIMLGYGFLGNLGLIFALLGIFKSLYFYLSFLFIFIFGWRTIRDDIADIFEIYRRKRSIFAEFKNNFILKLIPAAWILILFSISFIPSAISDDGFVYHLPFILDIINKAAIKFPVMGNLTYGHLPLFGELLYAIPTLLFKNFVTFKILQWSAFFLLFLILIDFTNKYLKNRSLIFLVIVWLLAISPLNRSGLEGGMIDIFTFLFGLESSLLLIDLFLIKNDEKSRRDKIFLSSIFLGICLSTKYLGLFFALINCLLLIVSFGKNNILKGFVKYAFPVIILSGFWYLKNFAYTGNFFFPVFSKSAEFREAIGRFIIKRNVFNFLLFPFVFMGKENILKLPYAFFNACQFLFIYAVFIFLGLKKALIKHLVLIFLFLEIYLFLLFFWSHQIRFAIPALTLLPVLGTLMIDRVLDLTKILSKFYFYISSVLIIISIALFSANFKYLKKEISCALTSKISECFAERVGNVIYAIDFINAKFKNETFLEYWHPFYNFRFKNGNKRTEYFCEGENVIQNESIIRYCLMNSGIKYLIDYSAEKLKIDNAAAKLAITKYFSKNGEIVYEEFDNKRNIFTRIYKLD